MSDFAEKLNDHVIQFVRILSGPIERVWEFLYDGEKRGQWFASGPMPSKVGETFNMDFKHSKLSPHTVEPPEKMREIDKNGHGSTNVLLACEPPHRLVFTFGGEKDPGRISEVEFVLKAEGDKVRLTLTHTKIPDRGYMLGVSGGWHSHLDVLGYRVRGETPPLSGTSGASMTALTRTAFRKNPRPRFATPPAPPARRCRRAGCAAPA